MLTTHSRRTTPRLRIGDEVEVRSAQEILSTLDEKGELESLPFMPEMLAFCGQRFQVSKIANKACDTITHHGMRRMEGAVHLEGLRCDGSAHGGCQASCLLYWKEAWLRPVLGNGRRARGASGSGCTLGQLEAATRKSALGAYACQTTELLRATPAAIPWWDLRQYVADVRCGNAPALGLLRSLLISLFNRYQAFSLRLPPRLQIRGGRRYPFIQGVLDRTPTGELGLQPGDRVEVRSRDEIVATLNSEGRNRGLSFDPEMLQFCGTEAQVLRRVERLLDEVTGEMLELKNPCLLLDGMVCPGAYHQFCPRGQYIFWRELWLRRTAG